MQFSFHLWVVTIIIHLLDVDPSDRNVMIGIEIRW